MTIRRRILWADDEIELLQPHIMFLDEHGYEIKGVTSGEDAVREVVKSDYDAVLLDEQMAGLDGIATLARIRKIRPDIPAVMITKSEEETTMNEAIGGRINDYLTKPVNPSQILSVLKKLLEGISISRERLSRDYVKEFNQINQEMLEPLEWYDWIDLYVRLTKWSLEIATQRTSGLLSLLEEQIRSANSLFVKYIVDNYAEWIDAERGNRPPLSLDVVQKWVVPLLKRKEPILFLVLDCLRLDQWMAVEPMLRSDFTIETDYYYSILPTATPYSRNSIFSGLFPKDFQSIHPDLWDKLKVNDEASVNRFERQLMDRQLYNLGIILTPEPKYVKILDAEEAQRILRKSSDYFDIPLTSMVFNFVDFIAHHRSTEEVIQTLIPDEAAYRSIVKAWFEHSPLYEMLRIFANRGITILLTSDHGSIRVKRPAQVVGDKEASKNLRFKIGRNLQVSPKQAYRIRNAETWGLPARGVNDDYLLAFEDYYFVYRNEYNKYVELFNDSFLHGGISLEEMIVPIATLRAKV